MTPAGPERDRQIAELIWGKPYSELMKDGIIIKAWSTEFPASIALWEEMKGAKEVLKVTLHSVPGFAICSIEKPWAGQIGHQGNTEADAISGAYVKWRTS